MLVQRYEVSLLSIVHMCFIRIRVGIQSVKIPVRLVGERQHAKGERMANNNDEKEALDEFLRKELAGVDLEGARFEWTDVSIVHATKEAEPTED